MVVENVPSGQILHSECDAVTLMRHRGRQLHSQNRRQRPRNEVITSARTSSPSGRVPTRRRPGRPLASSSFIEGVDLLHPPAVTATLERSSQIRIECIERRLLAEEAGPDADDVGIIVFAREAR